MLLRSLTKHVKDQNWFAVALDFFIVVAGILIAFQITEWNAERDAHAQERVWLTRLDGDFERILIQGDYLNPKMNEQIPAIQRVIAHIRSGNPPELEGAFLEDLNQVNRVWVNMEPSATYTELVATGELSKIGNETLRDKLATFKRSNEADALLLNSQLNARDTAAIDGAVQFSIADNEYETTYVPISYNWDKLVETEPHLQVIHRNQILREYWQSISLEMAKEIKSILEEELK